MSEKPNEKKAEIKIAAHVVVQLGQELVSDIEQALLELAKNAYDADAETCTIEIDPNWCVKPDSDLYRQLDPILIKNAPKTANGAYCVGRMIISDDGVGATEDGIHKGWLTISASLKRSSSGPKTVTDKGRTPVGDKGLGRLATMKIGDLLVFRTARKGEKNARLTAFSWSQFSMVRTVDEVPVSQWTEPRDNTNQGSCIEIIGLHQRDRWNDQNSIVRLIAKLSGLVDPYDGFQDFDIKIHHNKKEYDLSKIGHEVLNFASAKFEFKWDGECLKKTAWFSKTLFRGQNAEEAKNKFDLIFSEGNYPKLKKKVEGSARLKGRNSVVKDLTDEWQFLFSEVERLDSETKTVVASEDNKVFQKSLLAPTPRQRLRAGPFQATLYSFMFNEEFNNRIQANSNSAREVQEMAGVAVYRDNFRIRFKEDWLGLSDSSTSGNWYQLRYKNTLGFFSVTNKHNPNLIEKSDREGFVDNDALEEFLRLSHVCKKYANDLMASIREEVNEFYRSLNLGTSEIVTPQQAKAKVVEARKQAAIDVRRIRSVTGSAMERIQKVHATFVSQGTGLTPDRHDIEKIQDSFSDIDAGLTAIQAKMEQLDRASEAIESFRSDEANKNLRLLESAAVGLTARVLSHELLSYLGQAEENLKIIMQENQALGNKSIKESIGRLTTVLRELKKVIGSIDPLLPGSKSIREQISLGPAISKYMSGRETSLNGKGIAVDLKGAEMLGQVRFNRTRFYQILENLLQNSIYWIEEANRNVKKSTISISIRDDGFDWWDSGPGVVEGCEGSLFEPFISGKRPGEGRGLGLYIITSYLEAENCSISLSPQRNKLGRRYRFQIDLTNAMKQKKAN